MRASTMHERSERRGEEMLPGMVVAAAIVIGAITAVVLHQHWWVVSLAVVVEIAVIAGGLLWVLPVLSDGETVDEADAGDEDGVATLIIGDDSADRDQGADDRPEVHTPHVAA